MKKLLILLCAAALVSLGAGTALALTDTATHDATITINEVALIGLDDTAALEWTIDAPTSGTPGDEFSVTDPADATKFLQYTSIVSSTTTRTITVEIDADLPTGLVIAIAPTDASNCGDLGTSAAVDLTVTGSAEDLVTGIGSGYTGTTADTDGVQLDFTLDYDPDLCTIAGSIFEDEDTTVTLTYTLTEDA
ncbi:MAG: hypothetical protein ACOZBW_13515 [Thermodesulfobacteriota bacterium]